MTREQKIAWGFIAAFGLSVAVFAVLVTLAPSYGALGAFGFTGLGGLGPVLFRKPPKGDVVDTDERDRIIAQKSTLGAAMLANNTVVLVSFILWGLYRLQGKESISVNVFLVIGFSAFILFFLARSVILLALYGRSHGGEHTSLEAKRT